MKKLFTLALMCMMMFCGFAQDPGTLDEAYGLGGTVEFNPTNKLEENPLVNVQEDGKILIVFKSRKDGANYYIGVTRQNPDGSTDETYGTNGYSFFQQQLVYLNEPMSSVIGEDGQLYIACRVYADEVINSSYILCVDENGFANPNFGEDGFALCDRDNTVFEALTIDSQGRIYVAGHTSSSGFDLAFVQRYTSDGQLDTSWCDNGSKVISESGVSSYIHALNVVEDDKLLVGGIMYVEKEEFVNRIRDPRVWRFNPDGSNDDTFGDNGCLILNVNEIDNFITTLDVQPDGKYIVAGWNETTDLENDTYGRTEVYVARINLNGTIDTSFGDAGDGLVRYAVVVGDGCDNYCEDIVVAHDGQIFGMINAKDYNNGNHYRQYVFNINADGTANEDFEGGMVLLPWVVNYPNGEATSIDIQNDGKIVVVGWVDREPSNQSFIDLSLCSSRYHTTVAPQQGGEVGTSEIAIEVEVQSSTSVHLTFTPNEYTTEYFYGVLPKDQYDEYGEEFCVDYLYEYAMPTEGVAEGTMDVEADTDYVVLAFGFNANGERGTVAVADFTTVGCMELSNIQFAVYPNPATSVIYVETENDKNAQVTILDVTGRCVKQVEMSDNVSSINIEDVESGVYFIMVQQEGNSSVKKLVVK